MTAAKVVPQAAVFRAAAACAADTRFSVHSRMVWEGTSAVLSCALDHTEITRRRQRGLHPVTSPDVLRLLMGLPVGMPVPVAALTEVERRLLRRVPGGAVRVKNGCAIRFAVPPLEAGLALVPARTWRRGLKNAGRFTPFCARAMVVSKLPRGMEFLRMEADFYGIGVILATDEGDVEVVVPPAPFKPYRSTVIRWLFLERAYRQLG